MATTPSGAETIDETGPNFDDSATGKDDKGHTLAAGVAGLLNTAREVLGIAGQAKEVAQGWGLINGQRAVADPATGTVVPVSVGGPVNIPTDTTSGSFADRFLVKMGINPTGATRAAFYGGLVLLVGGAAFVGYKIVRRK